MTIAIICSILALAVIGWVLYVNAKDRRSFEKELAEDIDRAAGDDSDS